jgi:hypothetical protein
MSNCEITIGKLEIIAVSYLPPMRIFALICLITCSSGPAVAGYNAIFFAPKNNIVGASYGQASKEKAIKIARRQCRERGGRGCKQVMWSNRCSSLYVSPNTGKYGWGASWGNSRNSANANAYASCKKKNIICVRRIAACEDAYED